LILVFLALVACTPRIPDPVASAFRDPGAPIYSSAVVEVSRLSGDWVQVATFAPGAVARCAPGSVTFDGDEIRWDLCLAQGGQGGAGPVLPGKPGRFGVEDMADWWVLWVDGDYRTLVIGTPSGEFGFVLNRAAEMPADRMKAVRDILRFNGYDIENMSIF